MTVYRLLHVEDLIADALLIERALKRGGIDADIVRVDTEADFREAFARGGWDAILADSQLPSFSGSLALAITRQRDRSVPFIMVSGAVGEEEVAALIRQGANDFVSKENLARLPTTLIREIRDCAARAERSQLQERFELMSMAVAQSAGMVIVTDAEGVIEYVNPKFTQISGYSLEDLAGCTPRVLKSGKSKPAVYESLWRTIKGGKGWHGDLINRRRDGTLFHVRASIAPVFDADGAITHFIGIQEDVTKQRRAEEALRQSESRYRSITASARDAIIVIDAEGRVVAWNLGAETAFGYSEAEAVGQGLDIIIPDSIAPFHQRRLADAVARERVSQHRPLIESWARHRDGHEFPVEIALGSWQANDQPFFSAAIRDITLRKQTERDLIAAKETAESANQAKTVFLSHMSHELRTPLTSILGYGEMIALRSQDPTTHAYATHVLTSGRHLLSIIEQLLDLTRAEMGNYRIVPTETDITSVCREAVAMMAPKVAERSLLLSYLPSAPICIRTDPRAFRQILVNLLGNAVKYTPAGGIIQLEVIEDGDRVTVEVRDNGQGMSQEQLTRLFEPFHQADPMRADPSRGVGLGLAISRHIVALLGGAIRFDSRIGRGTTVSLRLPTDVPNPANRTDGVARVIPPQDA